MIDVYLGNQLTYTIRNILYDLYDINSTSQLEIESDAFSIANLFLNNSYSNKERDDFSEGLLYIVMVSSKATTFEEFFNYLDLNYIKDSKEKEKIRNVLSINGLDNQGRFTLNENGDIISSNPKNNLNIEGYTDNIDTIAN